MRLPSAAILALTIGCRGAPVGSTDDAASQSDVRVDAGGSNLLLNGDFEMGCAGWTTDYAALSLTSTAHSGKAACMLCGERSDRGYQIWQVVDGSTLVVGKKYLAEAWVRRATADGGATGASNVAVLPRDLDGNSLGLVTGGDVPMTDEWQHLTAIITHEPKTKAAEVQIGSGAPNTCIIVDDASFNALP